MPRETIDNYKIDLEAGGNMTLDLKELAKESRTSAKSVYERMRMKIVNHKKRTGQDLISRKNGRYVTIFRVG